MDDERLKNPNGHPDYFDGLLEHIRDIKASEKRFYQKLRDLFKLSSDYDTHQKATQMFFAKTQINCYMQLPIIQQQNLSHHMPIHQNPIWD